MDRKKKIVLAVSAPVLILCLLYASGYIAQLLINYKAWQENGGMLGPGSSPLLPSTNFFSCISALFTMPQGLIGIAVLAGVLLVLFVFVFRIGRDGRGTPDPERKLIYADDGSYGTSGFMTDQEMKGVLECTSVDKTTAVILGKKDNKVVCLPNDTFLNKNMAVFGASGSMKSRAIIRNIVLQAARRNGGESLILMDPKSEMFEDLAAYLSAEGYVVRVLNLVRPEHGDSWNCLNDVQGDELTASLLCDTIIKNTIGDSKGDHFWDNSELCLLKALVLNVCLTFPEHQRNMPEVYNLLCNKTEAELTQIFDQLPVGHPAKAPYNIFKQASDTVRSGVIIGLASRLQVFQNDLIRKITTYNEIDLEMPGRQKTAFFCITSDQHSSLDFLSSLFFSFLFIRLVNYADSRPSRKCAVPVNFVFDEFPNCGRILDIGRKISTIRSRDLQVAAICFQNLAQLQNRYPNNEWQEILGNCSTQIALGCTDELTASYLSDRTGEVTIGVSSTGKTLNSMQISNYTTQYRETSSVGRRKLMTMDEVLRMPFKKELVIIQGQKVLMLDKYDYLNHPDAKKLIPCRVSDYIPQWRAEEGNTRTAPIPTPSAPEQNPPPAPDFTWSTSKELEAAASVEEILAPAAAPRGRPGKRKYRALND